MLRISPEKSGRRTEQQNVGKSVGKSAGNSTGGYQRVIRFILLSTITSFSFIPSVFAITSTSLAIPEHFNAAPTPITNQTRTDQPGENQLSAALKPGHATHPSRPFQLPMINNLDRPPFLWADPCTGHSVGAIPDLMNAMFAELSSSYNYIFYPYSRYISQRILSDTQAGALDGTLMPKSFTANFLHFGQQAFLDFDSAVYSRFDSRSDRNKNISNWNDLRGKKGAVITFPNTGKITQKFNTFRQQHLELHNVYLFKNGIEALRNGDIDYLLSERNIGLALLGAENEDISSSPLLPNVFQGVYLGIAKHSGYQDYISHIDNSIKMLRLNGREKMIYEKNIERWHHRDECHAKLAILFFD